MRFLIFNIAVALALVYLVTGKTTEGVGNDAIGKVWDTVEMSAMEISTLLDKTATETPVVHPSSNAALPIKRAPQTVTSRDMPRSPFEPAQNNALEKLAQNQTPDVVAGTSSASVTQSSGAEDKLPEIAKAVEVSIPSVNRPPHPALPELAMTDAMPAYMNPSQRSGELERLVDDMELFAVRMLKR